MENCTRTCVLQWNVSDIVGAHKLQYTEESYSISASENVKRMEIVYIHETCPVFGVPETFAFGIHTTKLATN